MRLRRGRPRAPRPPGGWRATRRSAAWTLSVTGMRTSALLPSALSVATPGWGPLHLSPTPHHPTPRIWSIPLHLVLVHWNRCLLLSATTSSILLCFSVLFLPPSLCCLPKTTSSRCGGGRACCRGRQSADRRCHLARQGRQRSWRWVCKSFTSSVLRPLGTPGRVRVTPPLLLCPPCTDVTT